MQSIEFDRDQIMELWRFAVTSYLWKANRDRLLQPSGVPLELNDVILRQTQRRWNIHITQQMTKQHFLGYAGRYIRRLPISQKRILGATREEVVYQTKDTRSGTLLAIRCAPAEFVSVLSQHVPDHYQHSMRYFGLLAPRTKRATLECRLSLPGAEAPISPEPPELEEILDPRFPTGCETEAKP